LSRAAGRVLVVALACAAGALAGAFSACQIVDIGAPPADVNACRPSQQFFVDEIWPNVIAKDYGGKHCADAACHNPSSGRRPSFIPNPQPALTPGVALTGPLPDDWAQNYRQAADEMSCSTVSASNLILYGEGQKGHPGGMLFTSTDPEDGKLRMWVAAP
jgi:hypothetical protein